MFYKLLGYIVWNGGKMFLRTRYGSAYAPKSVLAGAVVVAGGLAVAILAVEAQRIATSERAGRRPVWDDWPSWPSRPPFQPCPASP